jgi:hypothetical protein
MFAEDEQLEVAGGLAEWLSVCVEDLDIVAAFACEAPEFPGCAATSVSQPADSAWCQHLIQQLQQGFEGRSQPMMTGQVVFSGRRQSSS